jgi:hypothetical protein
MNGPYKAANPMAFEASASPNTGDKRRLLALAEEDYYLTNQPPRASRWYHPLRHSMQAKRRSSLTGEAL